MKFFADTADVDVIAELTDLGVQSRHLVDRINDESIWL